MTAEQIIRREPVNTEELIKKLAERIHAKAAYQSHMGDAELLAQELYTSVLIPAGLGTAEYKSTVLDSQNFLARDVFRPLPALEDKKK